MTAEELAAFAADVRAECDAALERLATVDPDGLPADLRAEYEAQLQRWLELRALTEDETMLLHLAGAEHAGRELTQEESGALARSRLETGEQPKGYYILDPSHDQLIDGEKTKRRR